MFPVVLSPFLAVTVVPSRSTGRAQLETAIPEKASVLVEPVYPLPELLASRRNSHPVS